MECTYLSLEADKDRPIQPSPTLSGTARLVQRAVIGALAAAAVMLVTIVGAHLSPSVEIVQPDARLIPNAAYVPQNNCTSLHDGSFRCVMLDNGRDTTIIYDGASGRIRATTQHADNQPLGNLMLLWGSPDGYAVRGNLLILFWDKRDTAAYINQCTLSATSPVWQVEYGSQQTRQLAWHGFIGRVNNCRPT